MKIQPRAYSMLMKAPFPRVHPTGRTLTIIGLLMAAILVGLPATQEWYYLLILALVLILVLGVALSQPRTLVAFFYVSVFVPTGYLSRYFGALPAIILWLPHLFLFVAMLWLLVARPKLAASAAPWPVSLMYVGLAWMAMTLLSLIANGSSPIAAVLSLRGFFLIYGSVLLHRLQFTSEDQEKLIRSLVWAGLVMVPVSIFQRFVLVEALRLNSGDLVAGLFTVDTDLLFFQSFCIMAVASWWLGGHRLLPISPPLAIVLLFIPLAIGNSKAAPIYFFFVAGFLFWQFRRQISARMLGALLVVTILGVVGTLAFDRIFQMSYGVSYSVVARYYNVRGALSYLMDRGTTGSGLQRGAAVLFNYDLIKKEPLSLLLGLGPGSLSDSRVPGGTGYVFAMYPLLHLNNNSLATVLGEQGLVGACLLGGLLCSLFFLNDSKESSRLINLRRSTVVLFAGMLIYASVLLSPLVGLVFGALCIQSRRPGGEGR